MNAIRQAVDAVVQAGGWNETVFLLTWDDWGGWDDHVATPNLEHTPDGVQLAYGPRVPLPPRPLPPPPAPASQPVGPVLLRDGSTLPPPNDTPIKTTP